MQKRKNMLLFVTDQWRWDTLHLPDHPAKLPNLRAFAKEAATFSNAFTPVPLCTPARGSLFTGKLPHQHGAMDNVQGRSFYPHGKLHPEQVTYLERLQDDGYRLSFIGKWHLGDRTLLDRGIHDTALSDGGDMDLMKTAEITFGGPRNSPYYATITDGVALDEQRVNLAIDKLPELAASDQPFCLVVCLHGPHFPHHVPKEFVDLYKDLPKDYVPDNWCEQFSEQGKPAAQGAYYWPCQDTSHMTQQDWRRTAQHYWGFCSWIDALFGRLCAAVSDNGLDDDTLIAFTADHGEMLGAHGWFDKGPFFYEEVVRIPMMVKDPSVTDGTTHDNFVSFHDLFPTLIDRALAGEVLTDAERQRSFWRSDADHAFLGYDAYQGRQFRFRGIRSARYKYVWSPHDIAELYDLEADPQERHNRADDPTLAEVRQDLHKTLFDWMRAEGDWLAGPGHHAPVGSYIDGRAASEQHDHGPM
ncbi:arylsulfatase A-like enzyme [Shimia isoporae]|uniref:Arylsulfatase A-like enzyme n=1 Tax=Shimia isoporae TaxID=647720 RepID=A0A4R1NNY4_9RHOB|nr:sulfatase-like hydrolase/transferase [Shimia isoporae]TCL08313.1 arylsulfatase A-like enzyme [Shimia isoporae]